MVQKSAGPSGKKRKLKSSSSTSAFLARASENNKSGVSSEKPRQKFLAAAYKTFGRRN